MIISKTPFRISLFGGTTDFPEFYYKYSGLVVGFAIDKYAYVSVRELPNFFDYKSRIVYSKIETVYDNLDIEHPAINAAIQYLDNRFLDVHDKEAVILGDMGLEITHTADMPSRSGLGTSSTFVCGLLNALGRLKHKGTNKQDLALDAIDIERNILREHGGHQDQYFAAYGGIISVVFNQDKNYVTPISFDTITQSEMLSHMTLFYTRIHRISGEITSSYSDDDAYRLKILSVAINGLQELKKKNWANVGELLRESWEIKKQISSKISNDIIDDTVNTFMKNGAWGCKCLGAGGGGCILVMHATANKDKIRSVAPEFLVEIPFKISQEGSKIILP